MTGDPFKYEVVAICDKCLALLSIHYKLTDGTLIIEPRGDIAPSIIYTQQGIVIGLLHKPMPINDTPSCRGTLQLLATDYLPAGRYESQIVAKGVRRERGIRGVPKMRAYR